MRLQRSGVGDGEKVMLEAAMKILLFLLAVLLGGCVAQPDRVYWKSVYDEDRYYKYVCHFDPATKVYDAAWGEYFPARCFRTMDLKPRQP